MKLRVRRLLVVGAAFSLVAVWLLVNPESYDVIFTTDGNNEADYSTETTTESNNAAPLATEILAKIEVKERASKTGYKREMFYTSWPTVDGCSLRQRIIKREFGESAELGDDNCTVQAGNYNEPYTGEDKIFTTKSEISAEVQIDHVVALSNAWQTGAQEFDAAKRYELATDPLNLLAVDAVVNQGKSDGDAATWLPENKKFQCQYVARQVSVKYKYGLWVTETEKTAILTVLNNCPNERTVGV